MTPPETDVVDALAEAMWRQFGEKAEPEWGDANDFSAALWLAHTKMVLRLLSERGYEIVPAETAKSPAPARRPERSGRRAG